MLESKVIENLFRSHLVGPETIGLLAFLKKDLDRALFLHTFIRGIRSSGVKPCITIVHIQNSTKCIKMLFDSDSFSK